jgi:hypothetical protein
VRFALLTLLLGGCGGATAFGVVGSAPALGGPSAFVWTADDHSVYLVGQDPANQQALIGVSHDDAIDWGSADFPQAASCTAVFGFGSLDVWVAGGSLVLHTTDGSSFKAQAAAPNVGTWRAIWGPAADHVYVAGDAGLIHTSDGGASFVTVIASAISSVWGSGPSDVYAVDGSGTIWHSTDGSGFDQTPTLGNQPLAYVGGSGAGDVFAGGPSGNLFHTTGAGQSWIPISGGAGGGQAIWGAPNGDVFIVGNLGLWHTTDGGESADFAAAPSGNALSGNLAGDLYVVGGGQLYHRVR